MQIAAFSAHWNDEQSLLCYFLYGLSGPTANLNFQLRAVRVQGLLEKIDSRCHKGGYDVQLHHYPSCKLECGEPQGLWWGKGHTHRARLTQLNTQPPFDGRLRLLVILKLNVLNWNSKL